MIAIIDYGAGNLHSVKNALDFIGAESFVTDKKEEILGADKIILPGVGAFGDAVFALKEKGLMETVKKAAEKPFLGICLGMQLLFDKSEEAPGVEGLGILKGGFKKIPKKDGLKVPHMGWNSLNIKKNSDILGDMGSEPYVYFVHSYYLEPEDESVVAATTFYGSEIAVAAESGNIYATQFHPEKSGESGLNILRKFAEL